MSHSRSETTVIAYQEYQDRALRRVDRMLAGLLLVQWLACAALAAWFSSAAPLTDRMRLPNPLLSAFLMGGLLSLLPAAMLQKTSGTGARHVSACAQMLMSFLLIALTGGRAAAHFYVFGSLALLAFYRDGRILATATLTASLCYLEGGLWLPQRLYGVQAAPALLWLAHTAWMLFADVFLLISCRRGQREMRGQYERLLADERFHILFEHSSHAHVIFDDAGILDCNQAAVRMMRCDAKAELLGWHPAALSPPLQPDGRRSDEKGAEMVRLANERGRHEFDWTRRAKDGYEFPVAVTLTVVPYQGRSVLLAVWHDLTERKQVEDRIASLHHQNELLLRSVGEGIYGIGPDGAATFANPATAVLLGYPVEELLGRNLHDLIHHTRRDGAHFPAVECPIYRALKEGIVTRVDDDAFWRKDGTLLPVEYISTPILEAGRIMGVVVCFRDISERLRLQSQVYEQVALVQQANHDMAAWQKELLRANANYAESNHRLAEANARLALQATTDGLTGLRNHRALHEQLAEHARASFQSGRALSFLLLDVDRFKQYNDSFGHPAGDQVLRDIAVILEQTVALEGFCARYGGEEFAVVLPDMDAVQARDMGEKIRAVVRAHWTQRPITVSVGAATCPAHSTDTSELIAEADLALYRSKQRGRDCVTHARDEDERWAFCGGNSRPYTDILREMLLAQEETLTSASEHIKAVLVEGYDRTIAAWAKLLDMKDKETEGHSARVTDLTVRLARWVGMNEEETLYARWGALLHDIGKMGVPDAILLKPDKLTDAEWDVMRRHPGIAHDMLAPITFLRAALDIPYAHHEKWDGSGYPQGLKGDDIPLPARLFAVIDVYDALRSDRPYRAGWPEAKVRQHLRDSCGTHFDPRAVNAFLDMLSAQDAPLMQDIPLAQAA